MSTLQEYLDSLAQTAGLDEEAKAGLKKALGNQKFVEELDKGVKRQSDYSRAMDDLKSQKTQVETQINQWREWYKTATENDAAREAELQELRGKVGTTTTTTTPVTTGLTAKDLEAREGNMIQIIKQTARIASRHAAKFGEELDVDAVEKIAIERGLKVDQAYEAFIAPRVKELEDKAIEEKVRLAREEGIREGLSKRDIPDEASKGFHPIFSHAKAVETSGKLTDGQRANAFAEAWNSATKKS